MGRMTRRRSSGFTLMELLVVVIIIGILATLSLPQFPRVMESARQAEARSLLGQIYQAERMYYAEHNTYTAALPGSNPLIANMPPDASTDNYFKYSATATATAFTGTATRKVAADTGRTPPWTGGYTITINETGTYTTNNY